MHDCKPFIAEFGVCKICEEEWAARPKYDPGVLKALERACIEDMQAQIDYSFIKHLSDASGMQKLAVAGEGYLRARLREVSFAKQIMPVYEIGSSQVYVVPGRTTAKLDLYGDNWEGECHISFI